jgi:hypothetical protein
MMMPRVRAAFLSRFILLLLAMGSDTVSAPPDPGRAPGMTSPLRGCCRDASPALIPLICRCLLSSAAATLLLQPTTFYVIQQLLWAPREVARSGWAGPENNDAHAHYATAERYSCVAYTDPLRHLRVVYVYVASDR